MKKEIRFDEIYLKENDEKGIAPCCYICTSHSKVPNGYIQFKKDGFVRMHRWLYWRKTGESPEVVVHLCGNKDCINVEHMVGATVQEAKELLGDTFCDSSAVGNRNAIGNRGGAANRKFTDEQVREIRRLRSLGMKPATLAKQFNTHPTTIARIASGESYGDVV